MSLPQNLILYRDAPAYLGISEQELNSLRRAANLRESFHGHMAVFSKADLEDLPRRVEEIAARKAERRREKTTLIKAVAKIRKGQVYIIRAGTSGPIKVGYSTNIPARMRDLQTGAPRPLVLLHSEPGSYRTESAVHIALVEYRTRREWFKAHPRVMEFVATAKASGLRFALGRWWGETEGERRGISKFMESVVLEEIHDNHAP